MTNADVADQKPLSLEEIEGYLGPLLDRAEQWNEQELTRDREKATRYYRSKPFGTEEEGRSRYVSADVRSAVKGMLPSILRVLTQADGAVEFIATNPGKAPEAKQLTEYVKYLVFTENQGFLELHSALKDALVRRLGILKWWVEPYQAEEVVMQTCTEQELQILGADENVSIAVVDTTRSPMGPLFEVEITHVVDKVKIRLQAVPPDEFLFSGDAGRLEQTTIVAHRRGDLRVGDLVAMGYKIEDVLPHAGEGKTTLWGAGGERSARKDDRTDISHDEFETDPTTRPVVYTEAWARMDVNGDGIPELRKFCCVGDRYKVLHHEPASHRPFALFCPDPEPHEIIGMSPSDDTMDLQYVKSHIIRGGLDSLNLALHPRTAIVEGQVNVNDAMNTEIGAIIRQKQPGMVQPITHDFVGRDLFPFLGYFDDEKASRTGRMKGSVGIDADVLQSSTKQAVAATLQHSQEQLELIVRIFAETGMRQLFLGLAKTIRESGMGEQIIRVRGEYVPVDPRSWEAEVGLEVRAGFGINGKAEKLQFLAGVLEKQELALSTLGHLNNPLVGLSKYRHALATATELAGFEPDEFWNQVDDQQLAAQAAAQPKTPSPEEQIAQAEMQKSQAEVMKKQMEIQFKERELELKVRELAMKEQELILHDQLEREKLRMEFQLKKEELEAKYRIEIEAAQIGAAVDREKNMLNAKFPSRKRKIEFERGPDGRVAGASMVEEPITHSEE